MSGIGGPGGIGGPKGPDGPHAPDDVEPAEDTAGAAEAAAPGGDIDALAAELASGKITTREAVDRLVDQIAGTDQLAAADRAELREMLQDLVANDPYLKSLLNRV